jgi:hypothetical protein
MKGKQVAGYLLITLVLVALSWFVVAGRVNGQESKAPSIEGTYVLVSRDLPDGTKHTPPDIMGLLTYTKTFRNFNVYWTDDEGKRFSLSYMATYVLTDKEYTEKSLYMMVNDESGDGVEYDLSRPSGSAPVSVKDGRIEIDLPLYDEPTVAIEGATLTATMEGAFVDHWKKVE